MAAAALYELIERIGIGGMAEVFLAQKILPSGGRGVPVVVKRILPHLSSDPNFRTMFVDEAKIAASLDHPNIVKLVDLGRIDDQLFLAFEYVEGADLEKLLHRADAAARPVPLPLCVHVT
ncbi:MAG TPA: protein kinase, partial [bacterium]|nr:protein kinase [bacterium]